MKRKLASVQVVDEILPIPGADSIEAVRLSGWACVVKKGAFAPGDQGVFFEIDSVPPDTEPFRFLWTRKGEPKRPGARPDNFRVRTMRLRGCLSQGLFLSFAELGLEGPRVPGEELTELLGVEKWEPPLPTGSGDARGPFPGVVPKTDEMRVQSVVAVLEELRGKPYVATLKCDGTSATFLVDPMDGTFHACSRNWSLKEGANLYFASARKLDLEAKLRARGGRYALQGEICGPGVQKNPLGLAALELFVFSVFDLETRAFLSDGDMRELVGELGLTPVPIVEEGPSFAHDLGSLLALAEGLYPGTKNQREGIVVRPKDETFSPTLAGRLSFKAISNRYLLDERD
jgi:RNA ligase (TIGR02306 family)